MLLCCVQDHKRHKIATLYNIFKVTGYREVGLVSNITFAFFLFCQCAGPSGRHQKLTTLRIQKYNADLPTLTHCAWDSHICILFPPTIAILTHKIRCKVQIFSCIAVYFLYILRKLPISCIIIANSRIDSHHIMHLTKNRLAGLITCSMQCYMVDSSNFSVFPVV